MGKILRTVNLIVNAIKPKQITWTLDEFDTGYYMIEKELGNECDIKLEKPTAKEPDVPFEAYCADNGVPWCESKKKTLDRQLAKEAIEDQKIDELKTFRVVQETLETKLKTEKIIEKKCQTYISGLKNSRYTRDEIEREKMADSEMCRILKVHIEKIRKKKEKDVATLFDPLQTPEYYLNRYNSEPSFKAWFDTNFEDKSIEEVLELINSYDIFKTKASKTLQKLLSSKIH